MKRIRLDGLTATVAVLAVVIVNLLLFSAGWICGAVGFSPPTLTRRAEARRSTLKHVPRRAKPAPVRIASSSPLPRWMPKEPFGPPTPPPWQVAAASGPSVAPRNFVALIRNSASQHSLPPYLVEAIIKVESDFNPRIVSHKGARGLMQVMPATARRFGFTPDRLFEPEHNLAAGMTYLSWLLERYDGDLDLALAAYNAGEGAVDTYGGIPPYNETRRYVKRVRAVLRAMGRATAAATPRAALTWPS